MYLFLTKNYNQSLRFHILLYLQYVFPSSTTPNWIKMFWCNVLSLWGRARSTINTWILQTFFLYCTQENHNAANKKRKQSNSTNQTNETAPPPSRKSSAPRKPSTGNWQCVFSRFLKALRHKWIQSSMMPKYQTQSIT